MTPVISKKQLMPCYVLKFSMVIHRDHVTRVNDSRMVGVGSCKQQAQNMTVCNQLYPYEARVNSALP